MIWRNGVIVTGDHTIRREEEIRVTLPDGRSVASELAGRDPGTDLAVLKADTGDGAIARAGKPDSVKTGNLVLAIGRSEQTGVSVAPAANIADRFQRRLIFRIATFNF